MPDEPTTSEALFLERREGQKGATKDKKVLHQDADVTPELFHLAAVVGVIERTCSVQMT